MLEDFIKYYGEEAQRNTVQRIQKYMLKALLCYFLAVISAELNPKQSNAVVPKCGIYHGFHPTCLFFFSLTQSSSRVQISKKTPKNAEKIRLQVDKVHK